MHKVLGKHILRRPWTKEVMEIITHKAPVVERCWKHQGSRNTPSYMKNILMSDSHPTPDITSGVLTTSSLRGGKVAQGKETDGLEFVFQG